MEGNFFLVELGGVEGPMSWSEVLNRHYGGRVHDETQVWHCWHRYWYRLGELKGILVTKAVTHTGRRYGWEASDDSDG